MRILHILATVNPASGGPIEGVRQMAQENIRFGHTIEAVSLDDPAADFVARLPIKVHAVGPGIGSYGYTRRLVPWLREHARDFDCAVINGIWNYNALGAYVGLRESALPYFVFTHGMLDPWFKRRYPLKHAKKWLYWPWGVYPVLRDARGVFFTCEEERLRARESFWLYDCNEVVITYGTSGIPEPDSDYSQAFLAMHPDLVGKQCVTFLGRVHPKKGPDLLFHAVRRMRDEGLWDPRNMRLVMAGPADDAYAAQLRSLGQRLQITDILYWTGMVSGDVKWGALQSSEAFILPSHQENFGVAVAEALSAGLPVLISRQVNIWPTICDAGAGISDDDTIAGCARMLAAWLRLPADERAVMRSRARACFERNFTARAAAATLLSNIYLQLLGEERRRFDTWRLMAS